MAKPKIDFKKIMLEKGEKYGLIAGVALMVLFTIWGISEAVGSASTDERAGKLTKKAKELKTTIASKDVRQEPDPIDPGIMGDQTIALIPPDRHKNLPYFVDIRIDDVKRGRPTILKPTEFQVDFYRGVVLTYDFIRKDDGEPTHIYVLKDVPKEANKKVKDVRDALKQRKRDKDKDKGSGGAARAPGGPGGGLAGGPGGAGGPPGMMGGAPGMMGGMGGGMMGGMPGMMGGMAGMSGGVAGNETLKTVQPLKIEDFDKAENRFPPAEFIRPMQAVIVQASFPWKAQLEEYQRALRLDTLEELLARPEDLPRFEGFVLQRRIRRLDGTWTEWADHDWIAKGESMFHDMFDFQPDPPELEPVTPPDSTDLFFPLPKLARGEYPKLRLASIQDAIDKAKNAGNANQVKPGGSRFGGKTNVFRRARPAAGSGPDDAQSADKFPERVKPDAAANVAEAILIRFLDVDIKPDLSYEYRIQVKAANPNYRKFNVVGRPDYATDPYLLSEPTPVAFGDGAAKATTIKAPADKHVYAYAPENPREQLRSDSVRVQVHTWMSQILVDRSRPNDPRSAEPFGQWLVEDVAVPRGQLVHGVKPVKVPIWSPKDGEYRFVDFSSVKSAGPASKTKGMLNVDIFAPQLLVDFDGGKSTVTLRGGRTIADEAGLELLLLGPDGKLRVRSYWPDMLDPERVEREATWTRWLKDVKDAADSKSGGSNNPFDKGGPGGKGPGGSGT